MSLRRITLLIAIVRRSEIKAKFRQNGIPCTGTTVYAATYRAEWQAKLPQEATLLLILQGLWRQLEECEQSEKELLAAARAQAKHYPEIKHFTALPGIGFISAATISAILETPYIVLPIKGRFGCMPY